MKFESLRDLRRYFGPAIGSVNVSRDRYRSVPFESELERDWLLLTDAFDLSLRSIVSQPRVDAGCAGPHFPSHWEKLGRLAVLRLPRKCSIRDLQRVLPAEVDAFSVALRLAWRGELLLDPSEEWTRTTKFARG